MKKKHRTQLKHGLDQRKLEKIIYHSHHENRKHPQHDNTLPQPVRFGFVQCPSQWWADILSLCVCPSPPAGTSVVQGRSAVYSGPGPLFIGGVRLAVSWRGRLITTCVATDRRRRPRPPPPPPLPSRGDQSIRPIRSEWPHRRPFL